VFEEDSGPCIWNCREDGKIEMTAQFAQEMGKKRQDTFYFDQAFEGSDNRQLYENSVRPAIREAMLHGVSTTVFAYGQTASGKTYAMMGFEDEPGIIPQAIDEVFHLIRESDKEFLLRVSYMEIYNETIRDLLNPEQKDLRIHENRHVVYVHVAGCVCISFKRRNCHFPQTSDEDNPERRDESSYKHHRLQSH
jgi:hypothetical protein